MNRIRFHAGYWLIRAGIYAMPRGKVKAELMSLFDQWSTRVYQALERSQPPVKSGNDR